MLLILKWAIIYSIIAYVYREILSREDILNWWFKFGLRFENRFFYRPLWGCEKCFAGQTALWIYILNWISSNLNENAPFWRFVFFFIPKYEIKDFSVISCLYSVATTIFITFILSKTIKKINYE